MLVRLAHQFGIDEDDIYSAPVTVDLAALLAPLSPISIVETTVSVNQEKKRMEEQRIRWTAESRSAKEFILAKLASSNMEVVINPMEVRAFLVAVQK